MLTAAVFVLKQTPKDYSAKSERRAWTIRSQEELDAARNQFDIFIFDSFIPDKSKG